MSSGRRAHAHRGRLLSEMEKMVAHCYMGAAVCSRHCLQYSCYKLAYDPGAAVIPER
jgi:hypothetical protein